MKVIRIGNIWRAYGPDGQILEGDHPTQQAALSASYQAKENQIKKNLIAKRLNASRLAKEEKQKEENKQKEIESVIFRRT